MAVHLDDLVEMRVLITSDYVFCILFNTTKVLHCSILYKMTGSGYDDDMIDRSTLKNCPKAFEVKMLQLQFVSTSSFQSKLQSSDRP